MDKTNALAAFSALAQETRLDALRLLIGAGAEGLAAGQIAEALGVRQNTLSNNLSILAAANLVTSTRQGRSIRYRADLDGLEGMLEYLLQDCCGGNPALCRPAIAQIAATAAQSPAPQKLGPHS